MWSERAIWESGWILVCLLPGPVPVYLQGLESQIVPLCLGGIQRLNNNVSLSDDAAKNSCLLPEKQW
ncbi:MAG: hypothetical protein SXA11_01750 [Cyanobacteriota bacterium]|nr:hypothetical protein [Cyanobacteriota bacterium]